VVWQQLPIVHASIRQCDSRRRGNPNCPVESVENLDERKSKQPEVRGRPQEIPA
jgi:hypothetical protein